MKKFKILTLATVATALSAAAPMIVTSCSTGEKLVSISASVNGRTYRAGSELHKTDIIVIAVDSNGKKTQVVDFTCPELEDDTYVFTEDDVNVSKQFNVIYKDKNTSVKITATSDKISDIDAILITTLNDYLATYTGIATCHQAVELAASIGYDIQNYVPYGTGQEIAYDIKQKCFVIMTGDEVSYAPDSYAKSSNTYDIFKFVDIYDKDSKYSQYLKNNFNVWTDDGSIEVSTGLDVGYNTNVKLVKYVGNSDAGKEVTIRTYSDIMTVSAAKDTITHYGVANDVYVSAANQYTETGSVCYLGAKNTKMAFGYIDDKTHCSLDSIELDATATVAEGAKAEGAMIYVAFDAETKEKVNPLYGALKVNKVTDIKGINDAITEGSCVIRLSKNVSFTNTGEYANIKQLFIKDGTKIILDLNGFTLDDQNGADITSLSEKKNIRIGVQDKSTLLLMDSKRLDDTGSLKLFNTSLEVDGGATPSDAANFVLNGANIIYTGNNSNIQRGAVYVGHTLVGEEQPSTHESKFYMYGGTITAKKVSPAKEDDHAIGVSARGQGSYVQILYGAIDTSEGSICISGNGSNDNSYMDIVSGKFTTSEKWPCIYQPQEGTLNISGGTYMGGTCVSTKAGNININGGTFISTGTYQETKIPGTSTNWGNVIDLECKNGYSKNPVVTVSNAFMYSLDGYIFEGVVDNDYTGLGEIDFFGGNFIYAKGERGIKAENDKIRYSQNGGTWTHFAS